MKTKKYFKSMILPLIVSGMFMQTLAGAQENAQTQPTYSNAAQVNQATQQAEQAVNMTNPSLQAALGRINAAEGQLHRSQLSGDQGLMMAAETALSNAEDMYAGMLSKMSGVSAKDISDMHTAGVGWSDVANELGIHGTSGQMASNSKGSMGTMQMNSGSAGSMMGSQSSEIMSATTRDTAPGRAMGHGESINTGVHSNGNGGMMSGAGGLGNGNGMGGTSGESHSGGMSGDMGGNMGDGGSGSGGGNGGGGGGGMM